MPNQGNQKQAPALVNNKQNLKQDTSQFYGIPQEIGDKIFIKLGNSSAQIKIMIVLIGTKTGFNVTEAWITARTGLSQQSYSQARKKLIELGWLTVTNNNELVINYDKILE